MTDCFSGEFVDWDCGLEPPFVSLQRRYGKFDIAVSGVRIAMMFQSLLYGDYGGYRMSARWIEFDDRF